MRLKILTLACTATLALAACTVKEDKSKADDTATAETGGVTREDAGAELPQGPPVVPMPAATVIQSQPGPDGSQVDLLSAKVTGDILTVTLRCSSAEKYKSESLRVSQISVIDDATSQRIGVLKDAEGNEMVSNLSAVGNAENHSMSVDCTKNPGIMWAKFPAPPATSKTISLTLPSIAPFDGVPIQR